MKYLILDIETCNLDMKAEGLEFSNPDGWRTACVSIYDIWDGEPYSSAVDQHFVSDPEQLVAHDSKLATYSLLPLKHLAEALTRYYDSGYILVTKNGFNFDLPILCKPLDEGGADARSIINIFEMDNRHIDICRLLTEKYGYRFSLQNLVKAVVGEEESKTMNAAFAPVEWDAKNYRSVIDYCLHDCYLTARVFFEAPKKPFVCNGYNGTRRSNIEIRAPWP